MMLASRCNRAQPTCRKPAGASGTVARRHVVRSATQNAAGSTAPPAPGVSAPLYASGTAANGRAKVLQLLGEGFNTYFGEQALVPAVKQLLVENPTASPGSQSLVLGQGTWQVFHAPHISRLSSAMGVRFEPIQYRLSGDTLVSNVKFSHPLLGEGWLSAGGTMARKYDDSVEVSFDRFWVDVGADALRADLTAGAGPSLLSVDGIVGAMGRAAFFPPLAVFPVLYLDDVLAVFKFTPLDSLIGVHRVGP